MAPHEVGDDSYFVSQQYIRRGVVVSDGAHVAQQGLQLDWPRLIAKLCDDPDGPCVARNGESSTPSWFWVDSDDVGVPNGAADAFVPVSYKGIGGRQSGRVDAKIQAIIAKARRQYRGTIVLMSGDGDHAMHLTRGEHEVTWVCGWRSQLSSSLRKIATPSRVIYLDDYHSVMEGSTCEAVPLHRTLRNAVATIFPKYCSPDARREPHRVLSSQGMQDLVAELMEGNSPVAVVSGRTGCGKSTQIPQLVHDLLGYTFSSDLHVKLPTERKPRVLVAQPRRLLCRTLSERVEWERLSKQYPWAASGKGRSGQDVHTEEVGYNIGGDRQCTADTPIVYCTYGVLLKLLVHNRETPWDAIILDEVHEQSTEYDLLLALLTTRSFLLHGRRLVIMSATLEGIADKLTEYVEERCNQYEHPVALYDLSDPVRNPRKVFKAYQHVGTATHHARDTMYLDDMLADSGCAQVLRDVRKWNYRAESEVTEMLESAKCPFKLHEDFAYFFVYKVVREAQEEGRAVTVLVFLPGLGPQQKWHADLKEDFDNVGVYVLHSSVSRDEQLAAVQGSERQRIILTTNIAESGVTISDATHVVDLGMQKVPRRRAPHTVYKALEMANATSDALDQRTGRVGRTQDGMCYRIMTKARHEQLEKLRTPGMQTDALESTVLNVYNLYDWSGTNPRELLEGCLNFPRPDHVAVVVGNLQAMGALHEVDGVMQVTGKGRLIHSMPFDPAMALFVVHCLMVGPKLGKTAAVFASMVQDNSVFRKAKNLEQCFELGRAKKHFSLGYPSDLVVVINVLQQYVAGGTEHMGMVNTEACDVALTKYALARQEMHRVRPVGPAVPHSAQQSQRAMRQFVEREVMDMQLTDTDWVVLLLLHAHAHVTQRLDASMSDDNPQQLLIDVQKRKRSRKRDANKQRILDRLDACSSVERVEALPPKMPRTEFTLDVRLSDDVQACWVTDTAIRADIGSSASRRKRNSTKCKLQGGNDNLKIIITEDSVLSSLQGRMVLYATNVTEHISEEGKGITIVDNLTAVPTAISCFEEALKELLSDSYRELPFDKPYTNDLLQLRHRLESRLTQAVYDGVSHGEDVLRYLARRFGLRDTEELKVSSIFSEDFVAMFLQRIEKHQKDSALLGLAPVKSAGSPPRTGALTVARKDAAGGVQSDDEREKRLLRNEPLVMYWGGGEEEAEGILKKGFDRRAGSAGEGVYFSKEVRGVEGKVVLECVVLVGSRLSVGAGSQQKNLGYHELLAKGCDAVEVDGETVVVRNRDQVVAATPIKGLRGKDYVSRECLAQLLYLTSPWEVRLHGRPVQEVLKSGNV